MQATTTLIVGFVIIGIIILITFFITAANVGAIRKTLEKQYDLNLKGGPDRDPES